MSSNRVLKTAFMISFLGHCLVLGIPGVSLLAMQREEPRDLVVRLEIEQPKLLPKVEKMGDEKKLKEVKKEELPEPEKQTVQPQVVKQEVQEKIEVVNPEEEAVFRYQDMVKRRLEQAREYPFWAKKQGLEGQVQVSFVVFPDGSSAGVKILNSSGSQVLDRAAVRSIERASPFPRFPEKITSSQMQMEFSMIFRLGGKKP